MSERHLCRKITHAINTPLSGVIGCLEILNSFGNTYDPDDLKDLRSSSLFAAKNLHKVLGNLFLYNHILDHLSFASPSLSRSSYSTSIDVAHMIKEKASELNRSQNLDIEFQTNTIIKAPKIHVKKILEEIIENACIFSNAGTKIKVKGEIDKKYFRLSIKDWGVGMSIDQIANVGPFKQFCDTQTGLGLGLFIAKSLIQGYGGRLDIKSELEKGTEILLKFPIK